MPTLTFRPPGQRSQLHEESWGLTPTPLLQGWRGLRARLRLRRALRELADDAHMLHDLGLTREQALAEADKPFWR